MANYLALGMTFFRRYWSVLVIIAVGMLLMLGALYVERQHRAEDISNELHLRAADHAARIQRSLDISVEVLESIGGFFDSSKIVDRDEFRTFVKDALVSHPEILAFEWVPRVPDSERARYEMELAALGQGLGIVEHDADGRVIPAGSREQYFPVFYVEPAPNEALGFDIASRPLVAKSLGRAMDSGQIRASDVFGLLQGAGNLKGVILVRPVYQKVDPDKAVEKGPQNLGGFAAAVLHPKGLISASLSPYRPVGLDVMLVARSESGTTEILHFHASRSRTSPIPVPTISEVRDGSHREIRINVPGGNWSLLFRPAPAFYQEYESHLEWWILAFGFFLTGISALGRIKNIRYTQEILSLARQDVLTGLPNRLLFQDRLEQALARSEREGSELAVLFLDLDRFKHINDSLGHALGDQLLQEVASRLQHALRKEDTVARTGGDEFIILLPEVADEQAPAILAEKLLDVVRQPYRVAGRTFYLSASIGISLFPGDGADVDTLVANADAAMYRAKAKGRDTYEFYSQDLTVAATERWLLESELRHALENDALQVRYQPEVELANGHIIGAEALACWEHPERGNIPADRFIPIAEESGLIVELGEYVLYKACRQARNWLDNGYSLRVAVNVSGRQLQRSDFVETVEKALHETGLPPEYLELEVSESLIVEQGGNVIDVLIALSRIGVTLSIDDFGTGYSSLAYLKRLPIDKLKIDRSFVRDLPRDEEDVAITRAVIALARSLGLRTIAEGVENQSQSDFLLEAGCALAQGFLFGRPVPPQDFSLDRVQSGRT